LKRSGDAAPFRGIIHRLPSGEVLLVARDIRDIDEFRDGLLSALGAGGWWLCCWG
jgi:hypothetical protein